MPWTRHAHPLRRLVLGIGLIAAAAFAPTAPVQAQSDEAVQTDETRLAQARSSRSRADPEETLRERVNGGAIGLVSASLRGAYAQIATDLMIVLDKGDDLRVLPIITKGSLQNIRDLLYLRGIDVGIVQSDVLSYLEEKRTYANIKKRIGYITTLYNEEFHLVAHESIDTIQDLEGKVVNFADVGSGTAMSAETVFSRLKINVRPSNFPHQIAFEKIKTGEVAAMVWIAGKPAQGISALKPGEGYKLLSLPFGESVADTYLPTAFTSEDYPNLIPAGQTVDTLAVPAVLAAYNWPQNSDRERRLSRFIDVFFTNFEEFQKPSYHPKWKEVNLTAKLPGWSRIPAAEQWLKEAEKQAAAGAASNGGELTNDEAMFRDFLKWRRQNAGAQ